MNSATDGGNKTQDKKAREGDEHMGDVSTDEDDVFLVYLGYMVIRKTLLFTPVYFPEGRMCWTRYSAVAPGEKEEKRV